MASATMCQPDMRGFGPHDNASVGSCLDLLTRVRLPLAGPAYRIARGQGFSPCRRLPSLASWYPTAALRQSAGLGRLQPQQRPDEAHHLPGHRHRRRLAVLADGYLPELVVQPPLRLLGDLYHCRRLVPPVLAQSLAVARLSRLVPGRLHQHSSDMVVACLGDRARVPALATGRLSRHQPQVGHQLRGTGKASGVTDLGQEHHRRERAYPPQTRQPLYPLPVRLTAGDFFYSALNLFAAAQQSIQFVEVDPDYREALRRYIALE